MLAGFYPALDSPVILFQNVIEILHRAVLAIFGQIAHGLESGNGGRITAMPVCVDNSRSRMVCSAQRFGEQALGSRCIAFSREQEVDRRPDGVHSPV